MPINMESLRQKLKTFAIRELFIEDLGWDHHSTHPLEIQVDGKTHILRAIAQKRGMVAYLCHADQADLPDYPTRLKIDKQTERTTHEHIIIFTDKSESTQIWQWVKREPGQPSRPRQHQFHKEQSGDLLIHKLERIFFGLDEEESLTITHVAARTRQAFDIDRVTKRFYDVFKSEHAAFLTFIRGLTEEVDREWYASLMLNRLMFIYFFQKKGFLDNDTDYLRNRLRMIRQQQGTNKFLSFYKHFLLRLFHEGLGNQSRSHELDQLLGTVPYLDGGLFDIHELERNAGAIEIADDAFERLFDFFDKWDWHLDDRPLHADNEINPDVLGYIFEKYINQKQMGAYYTKEDITGYIARYTVAPFILDKLQAEFGNTFTKYFHLLSEDPDRYIQPEILFGVDKQLPPEIQKGIKELSHRDKWNVPADPTVSLPTEIWREHISRRDRAEYLRNQLKSGLVKSANDLITLNLDIHQFAHDVIETCEEPQILLKLYHILTELSILDPTCGSGAFLFAALNILEPLYKQCLERMQVFLGEFASVNGATSKDPLSQFSQILSQLQQHSSPRYFILKSIVINNLYGVDKMKEAVEICKLRLFLKLVSQLNSPDEVEPLPDIDFNVRSGNTLVGFTSRASVEQALQGRIDFESSIDQIIKAAESAEGAHRLFTQLQAQDLIDSEKIASAKAALRKELESLEDKLNKFTAEQYSFALSKDEMRYKTWLETHQPFHWFIEFYGIMNKGGFDIIIGNPPYVEYKDVTDYKVLTYQTKACSDLYAFTLERSVLLSTTASRLGFIIPLSAFSVQDFETLQDLFYRTNDSLWISHWSGDAHPSKLFEGVDKRLHILLTRRGQSPAPLICTSRYLKWYSAERSHLFKVFPWYQQLTLSDVRLFFRSSLPKIASEAELNILRKLKQIPTTIESLATRNGHLIFYTRKVSFFLQFLDFVPEVRDAQGNLRQPSELKEIFFANEATRALGLAALSQSLFYWFNIVNSDCRNLNKREILAFPVPIDVPADTISIISKILQRLSNDYKHNATPHTVSYASVGNVTVQRFNFRVSKHIIDELDRTLASYYGLTEHELDQVINYDIKYRLGVTSTEH